MIRILMVFLFLPVWLYAQSMVEDTLFIDFPPPDTGLPLRIVPTIILERAIEDSTLLGMSEKKRWLFVPIDYSTRSRISLDHAIAASLFFQPDSIPDAFAYQLHIRSFHLHKNTSTSYYPYYELQTAIDCYRQDSANSAPRLIGHWYHETRHPAPRFKDSPLFSYRQTIAQWRQELCGDLNRLARNSDRPDSLASMPGFRPDRPAELRKTLMVESDWAFGPDRTVIDAELFFAPPEARRNFLRYSYNLRYRTQPKYESIEYNRMRVNHFHRISPRLMLRNQLRGFFGINRWKDISHQKHSFEEAFMVEFSLNQILQFNPLDRSGLLFGVGLQENLIGIPSRRPQYEINLLLNIGLKR